MQATGWARGLEVGTGRVSTTDRSSSEDVVSATSSVRAEVVGRGAEIDSIVGFLGGDARAFVIEGEAGIGKSTLWLAGIELAREHEYEILRARPAAAESSLSLSGLRDLLGEISPDARVRLPEIQRSALAVALAEEDATSSGVESGLLAVAVLGLLQTLGTSHPLLLAIDDLQWLDESSGTILVYVLRRLRDADVRVLVTCRCGHNAPLPFALDRAVDERALERLALGPLSEGAVGRLLRLRLDVELTRHQRHAVYEATRGNPFFALELARAGIRIDESGALQLPASLQELAGARLRMLPPTTRDALHYVAALGDPLEGVLERVNVRAQLEPALEVDVLERDDGRVRFSHPLIRAAAWSAADDQRRAEVHRALAQAVENPEERARHLAATAEPPDAAVAEVLEAAAAAAGRRGAPAGAADLLDRALELTPPDDLERWARVAATAAVAHAEAGHWGSVEELVTLAQERLPAGPARAAILVTATQMRPGLDDLLLQAIADAGETPVGVQARIGLSAQATYAGRWRESASVAGEAATLARRLGERALLGVALTYLGGAMLLASRPEAKRELAQAGAIEVELGGLPVSVAQSPRMWQGVALSCRDDHVAARTLFEERLLLARENGDDLGAFQSMLLLIHDEIHAGDWTVARAVGRAALDLVETIGYEYERPILDAALAMLEACEGDLERARALGEAAGTGLTVLGDRLWSTFAHASLVFTELCAGNASAAIARADAIAERFPDGRECWWSYHQGDELEALVLAGEHERALTRAEAVRVAGEELVLPRFLAWAARGEALVHAAEENLEEAQVELEVALGHHRQFDGPLERARTLLAYGNVLRRQLHRRAARNALEEALAEFERLGARHFVAAAHDELKHVGGRAPVGEHELTPAEEQIADFVAAGLSNREVAERLYVAVSTVEATLTRVYRKLGLRSRAQLVRARAGRRTAEKTRADPS